jgi:hypothetical protein
MEAVAKVGAKCNALFTGGRYLPDMDGRIAVFAIERW